MSTPDPQASFLQLSTVLTGFKSNTLRGGLAQAYAAVAAANTGDTFAALLASYDRIAGEVAPGKSADDMTAAEREAVGAAVLGLDGHDQDPLVVAVARAVMKLWYLGSWYQPFGYRRDDGTWAQTDVLAGTVVSQDAYTDGLAWQAMQSHAMGDSHPKDPYYWDSEPAPIQYYTGYPAPTDS